MLWGNKFLGSRVCGRIWAGACLEQYSPLMAWEFTSKQARNPGEMADHSKEGCLAYTKDRDFWSCVGSWHMPTRPVSHILEGAIGSLELRINKWMLQLNQRHNPNHNSQGKTMEVEVDPVKEGRRRSSWGDVGRQLRRGSLFCNRTATRTGEENDRNQKRDRNYPVPIPEQGVRCTQMTPASQVNRLLPGYPNAGILRPMIWSQRQHESLTRWKMSVHFSLISYTAWS